MPILILNQQQSLTRQKRFLDTFDDLLDDNAESGLIGDNNVVDGNVNIDIKVKSNPNDNMTGKDNENFCKNDLIINIEDLFYHVQDQTACERLIRKVLEQTCKFF